MIASNKTDTSVRIGSYTVYCNRCEIEKSGEKVGETAEETGPETSIEKGTEKDTQVIKLQPKVMAVLEYFLKHPGDVLTREQIEAAVWPDVTVGYDALTRTIAQLRQAFDDQQADPWLIKTIPKRGYSLIAPIQKEQRQKEQRHKDQAQIDRRPHNEKRDTEEALASKPDLGHTRHSYFGALVAGLAVLTILAAILINRYTAETTLSIPDQLAVQKTDNLIKISISPFDSISPDQEIDYFAKGITSELITDISNLPGTMVVSSQSLAANNSNNRRSTALYADYIISGDVLKIADQVQINIRLLDTKSTEYLWTQRLSIAPSEFPRLRQNVITNVINTLSLRISQQEQARLMNQYTENGVAFNLFLKARALMHSQDEPSNAQAKSLFQQSIDLDPTFGRAYSGFALSHSLDYRYHWGEDHQSALSTAQELAQIAVSLSPELAVTWEVLAYISLQNKDTDAAISSIKKIFELDQQSANGYALYAGAQINSGQAEKGLEMISRALKIKPEGGYQFLLLLGRAYYSLGHYEEAIRALENARSFNPNNLDSLVYLYACYQQTNNLEEADWVSTELHYIDPKFNLHHWIDAHPLSDKQSRQILLNDTRGL